MTSATPSLQTPIHADRDTHAARRPGATELLDELNDAASGAGMAFMMFLAIIPGVLPMVALTAVALVVLAIPMLVIGTVAGILVLAARMVIHGISALRGVRVSHDRPQPSARSDAVFPSPTEHRVATR